MRPFIPFENVCKLEMIFTIGGQRCENVYHWHNTAGDFGLSEMALLATYMITWWETYLAPQMSDDLSLILLHLTNLTTESSPAFDYSSGLPIVGAQTGNANPNNAALVAKLVTAKRGRSYRGRIYNFGWPSVNNASPTTATGPASTYETAFGHLINEEITPWELVVASAYHNGAWRTVGEANPVVGITVDSTIDSQRRRLGGRGT